MIIKFRRNNRYYYNEPYLFVHGPKEIIKLKISLNDYQNIVDIIRDTLRGIDEYELYEKYSRYKKLLRLFVNKQIFYEISVENYNRYNDKIYLPWLEEACEDVQESLNKIPKISVDIPKDFFGKEYLCKYFLDKNIPSTNCSNESFLIKMNGRTEHAYYIWKDRTDIYIAPRKPEGFKMINRDDISERILAGFIYYCTIISMVSDNTPTFKINSLLEVERKQCIKDIQYGEFLLGNNLHIQTMKDPIKNYNSLEFFVKNYDSKIQSLNGNSEYMKYIQNPLQIITIQTERNRNYYFSDISYERLSRFVTEIVFIETLKKCYNKDFLLVHNGNVIHSTLHIEGENWYKLDLNLLEEGSLLESLLYQENLSISCYLQKCERGGCYIAILNHTDGEVVEFSANVNREEQLTTVLLTWISVQINNISIDETFFVKKTYHDFEDKLIENLLDIFTNNKENNWMKKCYQTNLNAILQHNGFDYDLLGVIK